MNDVDLSAIDLNLLVALQALLAERHVTRAGERIHLSQPAMSRTLTRLRALFDDPLLVRVGQTMQPTPLAETLIEPLETTLATVRQLLSRQRFDPQSATGKVRIAAPDILAYMLVPPLLERFAREAPQMNIEIAEWSIHWRDQLIRGEVDLTIGAPVGQEPGLYGQRLVQNRWACVLRREHPVLRQRQRWTKEVYAALPHLLIGFTPHGGGHVDEALAPFGLERRVQLRMPYVVLSPLIISESDLVLTTARWLAEKLAKNADLIVKPPPIDLEPVDLTMVWHERTHRDPRQRWFRRTLLELASALKT